jgi:hypothetical protein
MPFRIAFREAEPLKITYLLLTVVLSLIALLGMAVFAAAAQAGTDVNLGASVKLWDDEDIYFAVSARYFDRDGDDVRRWSRNCLKSDDLAVALFLARQCGRSPDFVLTLRREGATWWDISVGLGVDVDVWFLPVEDDPGPPYGKAYGHWKNGRKAKKRWALSDEDCRHLVAVRVLHEYYGISVEAAMEWRAEGKELKLLTANEYRNRHVKGQKPGKKKDEPVETAERGRGKK